MDNPEKTGNVGHTRHMTNKNTQGKDEPSNVYAEIVADITTRH